MIKFTYTFILLSFFSALKAQDFQGVAIYKTATSLDFEMDTSRVPSERQKFFKEMMAKAMQGEFELNFNRSSSLYREVETLEEESGPGGRGGGGRMKMMIGSFTGGSGAFFKDTKKQQLTEQTEFFGKRFIIKDSLENFNWQLQSETKQIGVYTCYKATTTREVKQTTFSRSAKKESQKDTIVTKTVTAWYTPQIPVSHGPKGYWGLPGLILELSDGKTTMVCSKVVLNPKKEVEIEEPTDGDEVSNEEYVAIITKKMEEMRQVYGGGNRGGGRRGPGGGRGGGGSFTIEMRN